MFIIYDIFFVLFAVVYVPYVIIKRKWHRDFSMRFGLFSHEMKEALGGPRLATIWVHAVSVGEVLAVVELLKRIKKDNPNKQVVLTTVTTTGFRLATERLSDEAKIIYAPLDFSFIVKKFIYLIEPKLYICVDTEIWPNLYYHLQKSNVPIVLINGRISDDSYQKYKMITPFIKGILGNVRLYCMQSQMDADRIIQLGAKESRVQILGNVKFDFHRDDKGLNKTQLGFQDNTLIFIGGSTHPGEERILVELTHRLSKNNQHLQLILCPRHIERVDSIMVLIKEFGYHPVKFSKKDRKPVEKGEILVVDTIGQLRKLYNIADVVFVGKTLCAGGGQNMIEPAALGKPVVVGPLTSNFRDCMQLLLKEQAILQITDSSEFYEKMKWLIDHPDEAKSLGRRAGDAIKKYGGATRKTLEAVTALL